ncbi:hypothetical protein MTO96_036010, partial [Rhipicephalus appendiculatus]
MERPEIFGALRTDIGEEGIGKQLEKQRKKLRRKRKRIAEQMRQQAESLGLHDSEATDQAGKQATGSSKTSKRSKTSADVASVHRPSASSKSSKATKGKPETAPTSSKVTETKPEMSFKDFEDYRSEDRDAYEVFENYRRQARVAYKNFEDCRNQARRKVRFLQSHRLPRKDRKHRRGKRKRSLKRKRQQTSTCFPNIHRSRPRGSPRLGRKSPRERGDEEESRSMLYAALAVLGLLAMLVLAGLFLYTKPLEALTNGTILKANPCSSPGCVKAKTLSDSMLYSSDVKQGRPLHPCDNFYHYSCGGWATRHFDASTRTTHNEVLLDLMNRTLSTVNPHAAAFEPYKNLVLFYRSCIEFHTTPMPTDVRVRKALYLLDLSFTEWLDHNTDPIFLFYFIIRLSLSQGVSTLLKLSVIEKNREARVVLEVGMSVRKKFYSGTSRVYEERAWRLYMNDALFSLGIPNITAEVAKATLLWDIAQERKWMQAQQDQIHEHSLNELIQ